MASVDEFVREQAILAALKTSGQVSVNDLADQFGVSAVTVRKDLDLLERRHLLRRVRGGAIAVGTSDEGAFEMRLGSHKDAKIAIARAVAPLIKDGDVIALDSSTSSYYLAKELLHRRNLMVITNGLLHAVLLMEQSSARVLLTGGVLRRSAASMVGPIRDVLAGRGRISAGFFGVAGVSTQHGLMDISHEEAQTKKYMADACDQVFGLFDSSKVGGFGLHSFAETDHITGLYTDAGVSADDMDIWRRAGLRTTAVPVPETGHDRRTVPIGATDRRRRRHATHREAS